jgi:hypothetical protein
MMQVFKEIEGDSNMKPGDIVKYVEMTMAEGFNLQHGMNFRVRNDYTIVLMSTRSGSPYADRIEDDGRTVIYEGHDVQKNFLNEGEYAKEVDQPMYTPNGGLTRNGLFINAVEKYKSGKTPPELVKIYEKIKPGIWVFNGYAHMTDTWIEKNKRRNVFKFKLELTNRNDVEAAVDTQRLMTGDELVHSRFIPSKVKAEVWKRDRGECVECGSKTNLHYDHILPFSKGGTSLSTDNIQLLCMKHNLKKSNKIK